MQNARVIARSIALEESAHNILGKYVVNETYEDIRNAAVKHMPELLLTLEGEYIITSAKTLLDKLGIDMVIDTGTARYAIDVTVGNKCIVRTKVRKLAKMHGFLNELGYTGVVIRSLKGKLPYNILSLIEHSPVKDGVIDVRLGANLQPVELQGSPRM